MTAGDATRAHQTVRVRLASFAQMHDRTRKTTGGICLFQGRNRVRFDNGIGDADLQQGGDADRVSSILTEIS
jgi:hypothetical protein